VIPLISCNVAYGWASAEKVEGAPDILAQGCNAHKYILEKAYEKLEQDPAFSIDLFPALEEMYVFSWPGLTSASESS
jgi:hypothetical protein